jgi:peptidoglycan/LPS O-acetylase OafA/YrhL
MAMARRNVNVWGWISSHKRHLYAALALVTVPMGIFLEWFYGPTTLFAAAFTLQWVAIFYGVLLATILADVTGVLAGFFRWSFLREMGRISYCAYLIHFALSALLHAIILKQRPTLDSIAGVGLCICAFLLTIGLAELSMKYFEGPMLRLGHRFRYSPVSVA